MRKFVLTIWILNSLIAILLGSLFAVPFTEEKTAGVYNVQAGYTRWQARSLRKNQTQSRGAERQIYFHWPTEFPGKITQGFGDNPEFHSTVFGYPGHNGLDMRTRDGAEIMAACEGEVYSKGFVDPGGWQLVIKCRIDGTTYLTLYAHLQDEPIPEEGEFVKTGQIVGRGGNSGTGGMESHLHFVVIKPGAYEAGETIFPNDEIDPAPFFAELQ